MTISENWIEDVIRFWFEELQPQDWFVANPALDLKIRERFAAVYELVGSLPAAQPASARHALAWVIVLDQLPRNMFRGSPRAFELDARALAIAQQAIGVGLDQELPPPQRMFLYMPFQHSEDGGVQARSLELFAALGLEESLDYARQHQAIIERFGRFPHHNAILGRASTAQEIEFLKEHPGF